MKCEDNERGMQSIKENEIKLPGKILEMKYL
jgi:hypothetical protein